MFGKSKQSALSSAPAGKTGIIHAIPEEFYGEKNPVIQFKKIAKEITVDKSEHVLTPKEKQILQKSQAAGANSALHPANLLINSKFLFIAAAALFVIALGGVSVYYWLQTKSSSTTAPERPQLSASSSESIAVSTTAATAATSSETTGTAASSTATTTASSETAIDFPSRLLVAGADSDSDSASNTGLAYKLTDKEDDIFGTDPGMADSDGDGYPDGHEVYYLYDPAKTAPARLIDSGNVTEYTNATYGYKFYYPSKWAVGDVYGDNRDILFSTLGGENIEVRVLDLSSGETFSDWFSQSATSQKLGDLENFIGVWRQQGKARKDHLVYYFTDGGLEHVFAIVYHVTNSTEVNYPNIIQMMARSFRAKDNTFKKLWPESGELTASSTTATSTVSTSTAATSTKSKE